MAGDDLLDGPVDLPGEERAAPKPSFRRKRSFMEKMRKPLIGLAVIILIVAAGFGGWKLYSQLSSNQPANAPAAQTSQVATATQTDTGDVPEAANTETFKADVLRIEFMYPKSWKVTETEGGLRIESQEFNYKTARQEEVKGYFRIYIRKGARPADGKYIGRGLATKPSEKITYTNPEVGQRSETLLSSFGLDEPDNFAFFLLAGNFELKKGDTLGPDYGREIDTYIIGGGFSSQMLADDLATYPMPPDYAQSRAYTQAINIVKSLKLK